MSKWDKKIKELTRLAEECVCDDWDGQGAVALEDGLYERAVSILQGLAWLDFPAPDGVAVGPNGTVAVTWQKEKETFEMEFAGNRIEGVFWQSCRGTAVVVPGE